MLDHPKQRSSQPGTRHGLQARMAKGPTTALCGVFKNAFLFLLIFFSIFINFIGSLILDQGEMETLRVRRNDQPTSLNNDPKQRTTKKWSKIVADGKFNSLPLKYIPFHPNHPTTSSAHCVGENFRTDAWHYRSCEVHHLCFDVMARQFFATSSQDKMNTENSTFDVSPLGKYGSLSTTLNVSVSLRAMQKNLYFNKAGRGNKPPELVMPWTLPLRAPPLEGYYELPSDIVWIPIQTMTDLAVNPGHLLWDYFLPIFTLLSMFGQEDTMKPFVTDLNRFCVLKRPNGCVKMVSKFIPLLGVPSNSFSSTFHDISFNVTTNAPRSNIVCAKHALVGIGMLTDHGKNRHGQDPSDYSTMRNMGRGPEFYRFRKFMLRNMGIHEEEKANKDPPFQILVSQNSTIHPNRRRNFERQIAALQQNFSSDQVATVKPLILAELALRDQLEVISQSTVYICVMGGGAAFGSFLPRGSIVVLFFDDEMDWTKGRDVDIWNPRRPVMMDWDFFNNAAYLRVHWFPLSNMDSPEGLQLLVTTIRNEIDDRLSQ